MIAVALTITCCPLGIEAASQCATGKKWGPILILWESYATPQGGYRGEKIFIAPLILENNTDVNVED
jgi:hypothetical protein